MKQFDMNLNKDDENIRQDQVKLFLEEYKLSQYFDTFVNEGFDRLLSLFDITESDLTSLNVKRGHRRLLQRAIATARGVPISTPILINYGYDEPDITHMPKPGTTTDSNSNTTMTTTRTTMNTTFVTSTNQNNGYNTSSSSVRRSLNYHHHSQRKKRQYVPLKPVTAFDEFLKEVKVELDGMQLSQITSIAYDRWNQLSVIEKEKYESEALHANSDYVMDKFIFDDKNDKNYNSIGLPSSIYASRHQRYQPPYRQKTPDLEYPTSSSSRNIPRNYYNANSSTAPDIYYSSSDN